MKRIFFPLVLSMVAALATEAQVNSVLTGNETTINLAPVGSSSMYVSGMLRAERNFQKSTEGAENVKWYNVPDGYFAYYTKDGKKGRTFYDRKGRFVYNLLSYPGKMLPFKLRDQVKSAYYLDYRITHVTEIHALGKTAYIVLVTDDKTWKKLKIIDGEMELTEDIRIK